MSIFRKIFGAMPPPTSVELDYREQSTGDRYRMRYVRSGSSWVCYALIFPHDQHKLGVHKNHKYPDGRICVASGVSVPTLSMAKAIAIHWMTGWSAYVRSSDGTWPRNGRVRVNVPD